MLGSFRHPCQKISHHGLGATPVEGDVNSIAFCFVNGPHPKLDMRNAIARDRERVFPRLPNSLILNALQLAMAIPIARRRAALMSRAVLPVVECILFPCC